MELAAAPRGTSMTTKRDLKRRVRERQARTGESYMTALRQVRGPTPTPTPGAVPVVEMIDLSEIAAALGIKCRAMVLPAVAERIDLAGALRKLCAVLTATIQDPAFNLLRSVVLHGERLTGKPPSPAGARRFLERVRAGVGGISESGRMLALPLDGRRGAELIVFFLWLMPVSYAVAPPSLFVTSADAMQGDALYWR
jgi:hypothetical protein